MTGITNTQIPEPKVTEIIFFSKPFSPGDKLNIYESPIEVYADKIIRVVTPFSFDHLNIKCEWGDKIEYADVEIHGDLVDFSFPTAEISGKFNITTGQFTSKGAIDCSLSVSGKLEALIKPCRVTEDAELISIRQTKTLGDLLPVARNGIVDQVESFPAEIGSFNFYELTDFIPPTNRSTVLFGDCMVMGVEGKVFHCCSKGGIIGLDDERLKFTLDIHTGVIDITHVDPSVKNIHLDLCLEVLKQN